MIANIILVASTILGFAYFIGIKKRKVKLSNKNQEFGGPHYSYSDDDLSPDHFDKADEPLLKNLDKQLLNAGNSPSVVEIKVGDEVKKGYLNLHCPNEMTAKKETVVKVDIARQFPNVVLINDLHEIKTSRFMSCRLEGVNFEIASMSTANQTIDDDTPTVWRWKVKPLKKGTGTLYLTVSIITQTKEFGQQQKDYPVLEKEIKIKINKVQVAKEWAATNATWIIGTLFGSGLIIKILEWTNVISK